MFVFGTQYLRGASPAEDQWEKDMAHMKALHFNTIRAWIVWNAFEREEGVVDTAPLSRFLTLAEKYGLSVGLLFHLHAAPAWAVEKYPEYFYVNENGEAFEPAVRANTPGGGWPGLCFDHDEVRLIERRFITAIVTEARKHPNVAFYEPMNEPHEWVNFLKPGPADFYCYCPQSVRKFRLWLQKKYGTIDALNASWGHFYAGFDEIRPPRWASAYTDYTDFRLFTMDNVAEEIAFRRDVIKELDSRPVIAHSWGGGAITCANLGGMAFDDWKNAAVFDKWGFSAFPASEDDLPMLSLGCAATRCASAGKEYWQSELTAGINGTGLFQRGRIDDETFDMFSLESLRQGARGLLYWQYRKERYGSEFGGFALTDYDGEDTNLSVRAGKLSQMLQENADIFGSSAPEPAEVALVFSIRSYLANWCENKGDNKFAVDSMSGYYRMLYEENIPADILHEAFPEDLSRYKAVLLPSPFAVSPEMAEALKEYIKNGGLLISDPLFGLFDKDMLLTDRMPGLGFREVFGCRTFDQKSAETILTENGQRIEGSRQRELYADVTAEVLIKDEDGRPLVLKNTYGKGTAVLAGFNLGYTYSQRTLISDDITNHDRANSGSFSKDLVLGLLKEAGVTENPVSVPGIRKSVLKAEAGSAVILMNSEDREITGRLALGETYRSIRQIYGDKAAGGLRVPASSAEEPGRELIFTLGPKKSAVFRLE